LNFNKKQEKIVLVQSMKNRSFIIKPSWFLIADAFVPGILQGARAFLQIEPANVQVQNLESLIRKKMEKGFLFIIYYRL